MNEMVERVARAIWPWLRHGIPNMGKLTWDQVNPGSLAHETTLDAARAAIADMREPADAMIDAAAATYMIRVEDARPIWQAMVDEALKP